eukprot:2063758-Rhodomonas_salina.4
MQHMGLPELTLRPFRFFRLITPLTHFQVCTAFLYLPRLGSGARYRQPSILHPNPGTNRTRNAGSIACVTVGRVFVMIWRSDRFHDSDDRSAVFIGFGIFAVTFFHQSFSRYIPP